MKPAGAGTLDILIPRKTSWGRIAVDGFLTIGVLSAPCDGVSSTETKAFNLSTIIEAHMSEYQFYDFAAVDKPLTARQQTELRERSTRANITATSFTNEYHWGDLKGDPLDWMKRYFDAHVYSANWGSCLLMLRLPRAVLDNSTMADFIEPRREGSRSVNAFGATVTPDHWILEWGFHDDSGDFERFRSGEDGPGWMSRLLPLRDDLLRGDTRPLYLGWLACLCNEELSDDEIEPPLPAGLQTLTPAQTALVEFLLIDPDWLAAAAEGSAPLANQADEDPAIAAWLELQTPAQMRAAVRLLLEGRGQEAERGMRGRFLAWQRTQAAPHTARLDRRTVAEIAGRAHAAEAIRIERERKTNEAMEAKRRAEREQQLVRLATRADDAWAAVDKLLQRGTGAGYEQALHAVKDLSDALSLTGREADFRRGLVRLMSAHGKRPAWATRLAKAGFLWERK